MREVTGPCGFANSPKQQVPQSGELWREARTGAPGVVQGTALTACPCLVPRSPPETSLKTPFRDEAKRGTPA